MATKKRKVGAGGKPPGQEPSNDDGRLKRGRAIVTKRQLSERFDRGDVAAAVDAFDRAIALLALGRRQKNLPGILRNPM